MEKLREEVQQLIAGNGEDGKIDQNKALSIVMVVAQKIVKDMQRTAGMNLVLSIATQIYAARISGSAMVKDSDGLMEDSINAAKALIQKTQEET